MKTTPANTNLPAPWRSSTWVRYRVVAWLTVAAAIAYLCRNAIGVAESSIREDLGISLSQSGWVMGMFFWTYALFSVPAGVLSHAWGSRLALATFAIVWSIATAAIGLAPAALAGFVVLSAAQLCNGAAQAGIFPASFNSISHWIPINQRTLACAMPSLGMQIGAIVAASLTGYLLAPLGWRLIFLVYAIPGIVWGGLFLVSFRNDPANDDRVNESELHIIRAGREDETAENNQLEPTPWMAIVGNRTMWMLCGQQIFRAAGYIFFATWFPTFLQETRGISKVAAGNLQAAVLIAAIAGSLVGGVLTDWIWRRTGNLWLSRSGIGTTFLFLSGVMVLGAYYAESLPFSMLFMCLGAMMASLGGVGAIAATLDIGGKHVSQIFAIMNMAGNFAAAATPICVGYLFESTENWDVVLLVFAAVYFAGAIFWSMVNPNLKITRATSGGR